MLITLENNQAISFSELLSATLRTSLEPIPFSFEAKIKINEETAPFLLENKILKVGKEQTDVRIVFVKDVIAPYNNGDLIQVREIIALHENSASIGQSLSRAVIQENTELSAIYNACGGKSTVEKSFSVPRFYAYKGDVPSRLIARVCQEQGGIVRWQPEKNALAFWRVSDLFNQQPKHLSQSSIDATFKSDFLSTYEVPQYCSTDKDGSIIQSQNSNGKTVIFTPNKTQTQLNAMSNVLLNAKDIPSDFNPDIHAGDLIKIGETLFIVLTAAHHFAPVETGKGKNQSHFWLGVKNPLNQAA